MAIGPQGDEMIVVLVVDGPKRSAVGLGERERVDVGARKKTEAPLGHFRRKGGNGTLAFKEEQEPVGFALVGLFGNHAEEVHVGRGDDVAGFFDGLASGAFKGGFAEGGFEFAADRTPRAEVRRLGAKEQKMFTLVIFNEYKDGDLVGKRCAHRVQ